MLRALFLMLFLLGQSPAHDEPSVHESEHYRLIAYPPFAEGDEYLHLAEALYVQLEHYFGAHPPLESRLEVRI
jgi:hypothetical protein